MRHHVSRDTSKEGREEEGRLVKTGITHSPEKLSYKSKNNYSKFFLVHLNLPKICGFFVFKAVMWYNSQHLYNIPMSLVFHRFNTILMIYNVRLFTHLTYMLLGHMFS